MGKHLKIGGKFQGSGENSGRGENFRKKCKCHKCYPKMNLYRKFYPNKTMATGGMVFGKETGNSVEGENYEKKYMKVTNVIPK